MKEIPVEFDVRAATGLPVRAIVSASLFAPDDVSGDEAKLIVCIPGGSYTRSYYHPNIPGHSDYSFAEYFVSRNCFVLALDSLGMGASSRPEPESLLSRIAVARANHEATMQTVAGLREGRWIRQARFQTIDVTGVGHSMGGMLAITQQGRFNSFTRLAVLGWANLPLAIGDAVSDTLTDAMPVSGYQIAQRETLRSFFHAADVPEEVIAADDACATVTPSCLGRDAFQPGIVAEEAASIECPLFLLYGEIDVSPEPRKEVAYYRGASDITFALLKGAAHCHNFATTRRQGWQRQWQWMTTT